MLLDARLAECAASTAQSFRAEAALLEAWLDDATAEGAEEGADGAAAAAAAAGSRDDGVEAADEGDAAQHVRSGGTPEKPTWSAASEVPIHLFTPYEEVGG